MFDPTLTFTVLAQLPSSSAIEFFVGAGSLAPSCPSILLTDEAIPVEGGRVPAFSFFFMVQGAEIVVVAAQVNTLASLPLNDNPIWRLSSSPFQTPIPVALPGACRGVVKPFQRSDNDSASLDRWLLVRCASIGRIYVRGLKTVFIRVGWILCACFVMFPLV